MTPSRRLSTFAAAALVAGLAAAGSIALLVTIFEHKQEARTPFFPVVPVADTTEDPAVWGKNFPVHYERYQLTKEQVPTRFGGSEAVRHVPTPADPRPVVSQSRIEEDPRLKVMWAGYPFALDFREERGHVYMLDDQVYTQRQRMAQPGTCIQCHASVVVPFTRAGGGDLARGFEVLSRMPYPEAREHVNRPLACIDCHVPNTMELRVTRPGFIQGIRALKASQGINTYDVNRDATRQEMRTFVCAQCHVEYYFQGHEKRLVYPWARGLAVDSIYAFYQAAGFSDWTHALTGAGVLKAQHPEFEMWSQGVHARAGVACADCHMPYLRMGAQKISDHQVRSPLLNIDRACRTCHPVTDEELKARAERIQADVFRLHDQALDALVALVRDLEAARHAGRGDAALRVAREMQRRAQFYLDFASAENSTGFHAPIEAARILGDAMNYARQGQVALRDPGFRPSVTGGGDRP